jgi:hypothetical protein
MLNLIKHNTKISISEKGSCYMCKSRQMDRWPIRKGHKFSGNNNNIHDKGQLRHLDIPLHHFLTIWMAKDKDQESWFTNWLNRGTWCTYMIMYTFDMQKLDCQWNYNCSTCGCKTNSNSTYNVKELSA